MKSTVLGFLIYISLTSIAFGSGIVWPDLPKTEFVKERPATEEDVKKGHATFVIKVDGKPAGKLLDVEIPQYAIHVEERTGKETPVIVIQAEENSGIRAVGYKIVGTSDMGVSLLRELRLLGTKKPE